MINKMDLFDQLKYRLLENFILRNVFTRLSSLDLPIEIFIQNISCLSFYITDFSHLTLIQFLTSDLPSFHEIKYIKKIFRNLKILLEN